VQAKQLRKFGGFVRHMWLYRERGILQKPYRHWTYDTMEDMQVHAIELMQKNIPPSDAKR